MVEIPVVSSTWSASLWSLSPSPFAAKRRRIKSVSNSESSRSFLRNTLAVFDDVDLMRRTRTKEDEDVLHLKVIIPVEGDSVGDAV